MKVWTAPHVVMSTSLCIVPVPRPSLLQTVPFTFLSACHMCSLQDLCLCDQLCFKSSSLKYISFMYLINYPLLRESLPRPFYVKQLPMLLSSHPCPLCSAFLFRDESLNRLWHVTAAWHNLLFCGHLLSFFSHQNEHCPNPVLGFVPHCITST